MMSTSRILVAVVQMCYEAKDWDALNENIMLLTKRRSQLKQVRYLQHSQEMRQMRPTLAYLLCSFCLLRLLPRWYKNVTSMWIV